MDWNQKPYHSLDYELKKQFGRKLYKLSLDGGMTCPNRDGSLGDRGCIFCSQGGSGDFAASSLQPLDQQLQEARQRIIRKMPHPETIPCGSYIAYFQSYTNTYAPVKVLENLFTQAISHPEVGVLSIATRPDCLPPQTLALLSRLNRIKPVWVELGLQTIHPQSAAFIRRGYELPVFLKALNDLKKCGVSVIVHLILGLPGETPEMMTQSVQFIGQLCRQGLVHGIKLQLLHILKGTDLADIYLAHPFRVPTMEEYIEFVIDCVELLPPELVIHRLTGDGPKQLLIAPQWSANKRLVLNSLHRRFRERDTWQGRRFTPG